MFDTNLGGKQVRKELDNIKKIKKQEDEEEEKKEQLKYSNENLGSEEDFEDLSINDNASEELGESSASQLT